jgi:hypothetical protein
MWRHPKKAMLYSLVSLLSTAWVSASEYYVRSGEPLFSPPPPDRAIVYFARLGKTASWKEADALFIDDQPLGLLPENAFLMATVKPGLRLLWWTTFLSHNFEWIDFKPGRAYLLRSPSRHGHWYLDDPDRIVALVHDSRLSHTKTTANGLALLQEQSAKKYQKLQRQGLRKYPQVVAMTNPAAALPLSIGDVDYQHQLSRFKEPRFWGHFGRLRVEDGRLLWRSKREEVEIAIRDIRAISFAGLSVREHAAWLQVRYGPKSAPREAFFHSPVDDGFSWSHNRKFAALADAIETSGAQ